MKNFFQFTMTALLLLGCAKLALGQYSGGNGTSGNPFQIANATDLIHLSLTSADWDKHFIQTADIVFNSDHTLQDWNNNGSAGPAEGFSPIGNLTTRFTGNYNGQGYFIKGLFINRTSLNGVGFFGVIRNASISNLILIDADVTGGVEFVGIAIGEISGESSSNMEQSIISNSFAQGLVSASTRVGGFIGCIRESNASITNCHSNAEITASGTNYSDAGGFVGSIYTYSGVVISDCSSSGSVTGSGRNIGGFNGYTTGTTFIRCFSTANVTMNSTSSQGNIGGFIGGWNSLNQSAIIEDCFALGNVTGGLNNSSTEWHRGVGGFIGTVRRKYSPYTKTIINSYAAGIVSQAGSSTDIGGFIGRISTSVETETPTITNCYWDKQRTTQENSAGGYGLGLTTSEMKNQSNFTGWDFTNTWKMSSAITYDGYPSLEWAKGYSVEPSSNQIADLTNLVWLAENSTRWAGSYTQTADINAWWTTTWDYNKGWTPIGNSTTRFTGNYNGQNYKISNIFIDRTATDYIGFFGSSNKSTLNNIDLENVNIAGKDRVGALAGMSVWYSADNNHEISNCRVSGFVQGANQIGGLIGYSLGDNMFINTSYSNVKVSGNNEIGGLVGSFSNSKITDCYATGNIHGNDEIGGLVGVQSGANAAITRSYSIGSVEGSSNVGGFLGRRANGLVPANSFWDTQTSGQSTSAGGTGKTTAQMQRVATFMDAEWKFALGDYTWAMSQEVNDGYPFLRFSGDVPAHIWFGNYNESWDQAGNWSEGSAPDNNNVIIAPNENNPLVQSIPGNPATINHLTIEPDASLAIGPGAALTVEGTLVNDAGVAGLTINSADEDGTGSLIHHTPAVQATAGRHIAGTGGWGPDHPAVDWHMISSPVANQSISGYWTPEGAENDYDFYAWDESGVWLNQKIGTNSITHFNPAQGYLVAYQQTGTKSFTGTLNTGTVTHTLVYSGPGGKDENGWDYVHGWNLIGNPFPSAIDWGQVNRDTYFQDHYAYVWNREKDGGPGYTEIDGGQAVAHIPANQGFFVLVKDDQHGIAFSFNNDIRVHGPEFMKNNDTNAERLIVRLSGETYFDQTSIRIEAGTNFERDRRDALKLLSFAPYVPQLYTFTSNNVMVAVNSIPKIQEDQQIRMGVLIPEDGEYTLSVQELGPIFSDRPLYLLDNAIGIQHKLNETPEYVFTASAGTYNQRFWISFATDDDDPVNLTDPGLEAEVRIWQHNNILHVVNPDADINLHLYDISGRSLLHFNAPAGQHRFDLNLPAGAYFVKSSGQSQHEIIKIIIQ